MKQGCEDHFLDHLREIYSRNKSPIFLYRKFQVVFVRQHRTYNLEYRLSQVKRFVFLVKSINNLPYPHSILGILVWFYIRAFVLLHQYCSWK